MNSKKLLPFIFLSLLFGCGVKANPVSPPETAIKSYLESYTGEPIPPTVQKKK